MERKILQFLEGRFYWVFGIMLGIQIVGAVSIILLGFFVAVAGGGLDILEFDPPGLTEACTMLPFVFPLTLITALSYPRLKGRKWARWLLIFTVMVNIVLALQLAILLFVFW